MATLVKQDFNHNTPSAPTLSAGLLLGASGVSLFAAHTIGSLAGVSSADGSFSESVGYSHIDWTTDGDKFVMDRGNNRVQRFRRNALGVWVFVDKCTSITTLIGGTIPVLLAINRSTTPNEIHLASFDFVSATAYISVWSVASFPGLTTGNRLRQYGASASSNIAGRVFNSLSLTIDSTFAVLTSVGNPFRLLRWNHITGVLQNEETQVAIYGKFATDFAGNWWSHAWSTATEPGLWKMNVTNFTGISRLDSTGLSSASRRGRFYQGQPLTPSYYGGRIYCKDTLGRVLAFDATTGAFLDDFLLPGPLGANDEVIGLHSFVLPSFPYEGRSNVVVDSAGLPWFSSWQANANNSATQSFLTAWPMFTATATWTMTGWSAAVNTLQGLAVKADNISGEKYKIGLTKNSGTEVIFTAADLFNQTKFDLVGTLTGNDVLTVKAYLSIWDRLDGHATLYATQNKIAPSNFAVRLYYNNPLADQFIPQQTASLEGRLAGDGGIKGALSGSGGLIGKLST